MAGVKYKLFNKVAFAENEAEVKALEKLGYKKAVKEKAKKSALPVKAAK